MPVSRRAIRRLEVCVAFRSHQIRVSPSRVRLPVPLQPLGNGDGEEGLHQRRAALEANLFQEVVAVFLRHVTSQGVDEEIGEIGDSGEIERHRIHPVPDAFDPEGAELVPDVPVGEEIAKFGNHLEFEFHREERGLVESW